MYSVQSQLEILLARNGRLLLHIFRDAEHAEAKAARYAPWLQGLARSGLLPGQVVLGERLLPQPYAPREGGNHSGLYYQAALCPGRGVGAVLWDSDEYEVLAELPEGLRANAASQFQPLELCPPLVQHWLLPQIDGLIFQLLELLRIELRVAGLVG